MSRAALGMIRFYQRWISPMLYSFSPGLGCRFMPSCSEYAYTCIQLYGPSKGIRLAFRRLMRCHPFSQGGYDPPEQAIKK